MDLSTWNSLLLQDVRKRADPERLLYLYVDRETLGRLHGGSAAEALADFCAAFGRAADFPFRAAAEAAERWARAGFSGDPSFVTHLAVTVLAVTEDPVGAAHGVYARQNALLGLPPEAKEPRGYGEDVPRLWAAWNEWLTHSGSYLGRPSARTHRHWSLQGWARSQGLVRLADRLVIERYVEAMGVRSQEPSGQLSSLREWLAYRGAAGAALLEKLQDEAAVQIVLDVLGDETRRYEREGARRRRGSAHGLLCVDDWTSELYVVAPVSSDRVGQEVIVAGENYTVSEFDEFVRLPVGTGSEVLRDGMSWQLNSEWTLRAGGEPIYVLRDAPEVGGRLQVTTPVLGQTVNVLVHATRQGEVLSALRATGRSAVAESSAYPGWTWVSNVILDTHSDTLRLLGLSTVADVEQSGPRLSGGLPLAPSHYLSGGEPDLVLADLGEDVNVDGYSVATHGRHLVSLADQALEPGRHEIRVGTTRLSLVTSAYVREAAGDAGYRRPIRESLPGRLHVGEPTLQSAEGAHLSGALLDGVPSPWPVVIRKPPGFELLALLEDGTLLEIYPRVPTWVATLEIDPSQIDVVHALRGLDPKAAFLIVRSPRTGAIRATAVPPEYVPVAGRTASRPRPDLISQVISTPWTWHGPQDERRRTAVLGAALRRGASGAPGAPPARLPQPTPRHDVREGRLANPYDDVLAWLSERESCRADLRAFAGAWAWSCHRAGHQSLASEWRLALKTLSRLGHVERDFARGQVGVAPAALVALPTASGLSMLCGSRPVRLLERLNDPDAPDSVGEAASAWLLHLRTPVLDGRVPIGPTVALLESEEWHSDVVRRGLSALGVTRTGMTSISLLAGACTPQELLSDDAALTMPPSRDIAILERSVGKWHWSARASDAGPGLYRYRLPHGNTFGWRTTLDGPLYRVDLASGRWLALEAFGNTAGQVAHHPTSNILIAPADTPLPGMVDRALTLRSGLPPFLVEEHRLAGRGAPRRYLAFVNVDAASAHKVAHVLAQQLEIETEPLRVAR